MQLTVADDIPAGDLVGAPGRWSVHVRTLHAKPAAADLWKFFEVKLGSQPSSISLA
jgi:hypothetical protein